MFVDVDVGKSDPHTVAVTVAGQTVFDKALSHDGAWLRDVLEEVTAAHGLVLMIVDQPGHHRSLAGGRRPSQAGGD